LNNRDRSSDQPVPTVKSLMRVAHVTDHFWPRVGGIEMHVAMLAARQAATDHDVVVLSGKGASSPSPSFEVLPHTRRSLAGLGPVDVVHIHVSLWSPRPCRMLVQCVRTKTPTVVTMHSLCGRYRAAFALLDRVVGWSRWPIAFTAVSDVAAEPLRAIVGDDAEVAVLPNGIDVEQWRAHAIRQSADEVVVVAVARMAWRKRPLALLNALRRARLMVPPGVPVRAVIVGDGRYRRIVAAWNRLRGTSDWVELPGRLTHTEIRTLYRHADFFVAPARLESFGIAALEARCAGLPIVALAGTGIQAFVRDGHDGLIADGDRDLAAAIARLVCDDDSRTMMAACAIECVAPFSWEVVLKQTDEEYKRAQRLCAGSSALTSSAESTIEGFVRQA